ncbi:MAG: hypothetical protein QUS07_02205 [Methanothrix sp.]|nr:hypothetical protein [Methanothrix sp.]
MPILVILIGISSQVKNNSTMSYAFLSSSRSSIIPELDEGKIDKNELRENLKKTGTNES